MNKQEFEQRVIACMERMHRISLAILINEADCKDAVQDTLVRAWLKNDSLKEPCYFETWLFRILINECRRALDKQSKHQTVELSDSLPSADVPDPDVWHALYQLPVHHRLPLVLHHVNGYKIAECAQMLRLPQSTVKWRIHQGKKAFAVLLGEEDQA